MLGLFDLTAWWDVDQGPLGLARFTCVHNKNKTTGKYVPDMGCFKKMECSYVGTQIFLVCRTARCHTPLQESDTSSAGGMQ